MLETGCSDMLVAILLYAASSACKVQVDSVGACVWVLLVKQVARPLWQCELLDGCCQVSFLLRKWPIVDRYL